MPYVSPRRYVEAFERLLEHAANSLTEEDYDSLLLDLTQNINSELAADAADFRLEG